MENQNENPNLKGILVGCGFMGGMHAQIYKILEGVDLVAAVDGRIEESRAKLEELGCPVPVFETLAEAMQSAECDFVDVCLPTYLHEEYAVEALTAGKALFCEKPLALSVESADRILGAAEASGAFAQVGQCIRFWPEYQRLMRFHADGEGGRLLSLNLTRRAGRPSYGIDNWLNDESQSGGAALDLHVHDTDFVLALLGPPRGLTSRVTRDYSGPSHVFSIFDYDKVTVTSEGGWNYPDKWGFQMAFQAVFENAVLDYDSSNGKGLRICQGDEEPRALDVTQTDAGESKSGEGNVSDLGGYFNELKYFTDCLRDGAPPEIATLLDARESLAWTLREIELGEEAAQRS